MGSSHAEPIAQPGFPHDIHDYDSLFPKKKRYQHSGDQEDFSSVDEVRGWVSKMAAKANTIVVADIERPFGEGEETTVDEEDAKTNPFKPVSKNGLLDKPYRMVLAQFFQLVFSCDIDVLIFRLSPPHFTSRFTL